jgi:hypothetical protein
MDRYQIESNRQLYLAAEKAGEMQNEDQVSSLKNEIAGSKNQSPQSGTSQAKKFVFANV